MGNPQDIYVANLRQSYGYPLHSPEPRASSPECEQIYLKQGFQIGDVGYINTKGAFYPLFNICFQLPEYLLERGYPLYEPLKVVDEPKKDLDHSLKKQVLKYGVRENLNTPWPYAFTATSTQGAILIPLSDVAQYELRKKGDLEEFRKLATEYACQWCEHSGENSLYLITGTHTTRNFSLAAFDAGVLDQEIRLQPDSDNPGTHIWKSEFLAYCQIGPQNKNLYENQTIFIKGFRMTVRWSWLAVIERVTGVESPIIRRIATLFATLFALLEVLSLMANNWLSRTTIKHEPRLSEPLHPSDMINRYLLDKNPRASVAITHDNEWIDMLEKKKLSPENLMREDCLRVFLEQEYTSYTERGVVYLQSQIGDTDVARHNSGSSDPTAATENLQFVLTHIRAENVTAGLGRIPVGFYVQVDIPGRQSRRTKSKSILVYDRVIQWNDPILLPPNPSIMIKLTLFASFEFDPILGRGELLYTLEQSVEELLYRTDPFTFSVKRGEDVLSSASLLVSVQEWHRNHRKLGSNEVDDSDQKTQVDQAEFPELIQVMEESDKGHDALLRYHKDYCEENLKSSITHFEGALANCPDKYRAPALFNLATAKFVTYQVQRTSRNSDSSDLYTSISLFRKALELRGDYHPDRPMTLLHLAEAISCQYERDGYSGSINDDLRKLVDEIRTICPEGTHTRRAADLVLHTYERMRLRDSNDLHTLNELISELDAAAQDLPGAYFDGPIRNNNLGLALQRRFLLCREAGLGDLDRAIEWLKKAVQIAPSGYADKSTYQGDLDKALLMHRCEALYAEGRLIEATVPLLDVATTISKNVKADKIIMDWLSELANQFNTTLEKMGDDAANNMAHDMAITAYSTALSLGTVLSLDPDIRIWRLIERYKARITGSNDTGNLYTRHRPNGRTGVRVRRVSLGVDNTTDFDTPTGSGT